MNNPFSGSRGMALWRYTTQPCNVTQKVYISVMVR